MALFMKETFSGLDFKYNNNNNDIIIKKEKENNKEALEIIPCRLITHPTMYAVFCFLPKEWVVKFFYRM